MICACVCMYMHVDKSWKATLLAKKRATERHFGYESYIYYRHHLFIPQSLLPHMGLITKNFRLSQAHLTNRMQNVYAERGMFHIQIPKNTQK